MPTVRPLDRVRYFRATLALLVAKNATDLAITYVGFQRNRRSFDEYSVPSEILGLLQASDLEHSFGYQAALLAVAVPFLATLGWLTLRRLRDAGFPAATVLFLLAPLPITLTFELVLSMVPPWRPGAEGGAIVDALDVPDTPKPSPARQGAETLVAILLPMPFAAACVFATVYLNGSYGWVLFFGLPFVGPMLSVLLLGRRRPRTFRECNELGLAWLLTASGLMLALAFEGVVCLLMALPILLPVVLLGSTLGYLIQRRPLAEKDAARLVVALLAAVPALVGAESVTRPAPPIFAVTTTWTIAAPPERVWSHLVEFDGLPEPEEWLFRAGVAYPTKARLKQGSSGGVGAVRLCEFTTGTLVEPIEVWNPPRVLGFAVTQSPPPMREWSPLGEIHPPHLDGFLVARRGLVRLDPLPGGRTLARGTTWYQHGLWPDWYWTLWSDAILHKIHLRLLRHVGARAETEARVARPRPAP